MKRSTTPSIMETPSKIPATAESPPPSRSAEHIPPPTFAIKKLVGDNWRQVINREPAEVDLPEYFGTKDGGINLRVYDFAVKQHQSLNCEKGKNADCAFCVAQGGRNSWKGDPMKKMVTPALYLEVMKTYVPCDEDYDANFPDILNEERFKDISQLEVNDYFFERLFPMLYCSQCYPDLPSVVSKMDEIQSFNLPYQRGTGADFFATRAKLVGDLKTYKETKKAEFSALLKQISILSEFDWQLHLRSAKHRHQEAPKAVEEELVDVKGLLEGIKKQIVNLQVGVPTAASLSEKLVEVPSIKSLLSKSKACVDFVSHVGATGIVFFFYFFILRDDTGKTDLEETVAKVFEKVLNEKVANSMAKSFAEEESIATILDESHETFQYFAKEITVGGVKTTNLEEVLKTLIVKALNPIMESIRSIQDAVGVKKEGGKDAKKEDGEASDGGS